jgi:hypothetical protein
MLIFLKPLLFAKGLVAGVRAKIFSLCFRSPTDAAYNGEEQETRK